MKSTMLLNYLVNDINKGEQRHEQQQQQRRMSYYSSYVDNRSAHSHLDKDFEKV